MRLATGAELRVTGSVGERAVVCVNGGRQRELEGTWSASVEWLAPAGGTFAAGQLLASAVLWWNLERE